MNTFDPMPFHELGQFENVTFEASVDGIDYVIWLVLALHWLLKLLLHCFAADLVVEYWKECAAAQAAAK